MTRSTLSRLSALAVGAVGILALGLGPAIAAPTPTGEPTTTTAPTPTSEPTPTNKPTPTPTNKQTSKSTSRMSVGYVAPRSAHDTLKVTVTGLAPGAWVDLDGGAAGANGELAYHYEIQANSKGVASKVVSAPSAGWRYGTTYRFTVTSSTGQAQSITFRLTGGKQGSDTGGSTAKTNDSRGGLAKTGV